MTDATEMTGERALEITSAICARSHLSMGITDDPNLPSLDGVSLSDMLRAAEMVSTMNASAPSVDGKRTIYVIPAERLIAAVFVGVNYDTAETPVVVETSRRSESSWDVKAVAVVDVTQKFQLVDGKGAAA